MKRRSCGPNQFLDRVYLHSKAELNKNQSFRYHYFLNENTAFSFDFWELELCDVSGSDTTALSEVHFSFQCLTLSVAHWHIEMNGAVGLFEKQYINLGECLLETNLSADNHKKQFVSERKEQYRNEMWQVADYRAGGMKHLRSLHLSLKISIFFNVILQWN